MTTVRNQTSEPDSQWASVAAAGMELWCRCDSAASSGRSSHWDDCTASRRSLLRQDCTQKSWTCNSNQS